MSKYFGTDGFRGEVNKTLKVDHAYKVGRFLGQYFRSGGRCRVVIGKDTRRSSYMLEYALVAGLTASAADVYLLHVTTTPSVSYVVRTEDFDCGIMISASHNPYYDNGIKIINSRGEKLEQSVIDKIEEYLDSPEDTIPLALRNDIGCTVDYSAGRNRYIGYLISLALRSYKGMNIGLDCANGSSWMIAKSVFDALGANVHVINNHPNGFNINENCGSTNVSQLRRYVLDNKLDVGFAYDGDADRCIAVDETGRIIDGDLILYIYGKYLKENDKLVKNTVVTTVMSNFGLYKALDEVGIDYVKTDVGDKYVYECMNSNGYRIGGEQSGHIIFSKYASTGDGILTSIKLMEVMLEYKQPLSKLAEPVKIYPQIIKNVKVADKEAVLEDSDVKGAILKAESFLEGNGRILVRPSGTEPIIRIMAEAETDEICNKCIDIINNAVIKKGFAQL